MYVCRRVKVFGQYQVVGGNVNRKCQLVGGNFNGECQVVEVNFNGKCQVVGGTSMGSVR